MNYSFFSSLIVRTPLYSFKECQEENYPSLLQDKTFQMAIFLASKAFYNELEKKQFDYKLLTEKQKHTIKKYINRAAFRSTPFGLFSAFSLVQWVNQSKSKLSLSSNLTPFIKLDFSVLAKLWEKSLMNRNDASLQFRLNQSLYFSKKDLRYYRTAIDEMAQTHFSIVAAAKNPVLKKLLRFCKNAKSFDEICLFLLHETGVEKEVAEAFIRELMDQQILIVDDSPNVTGEDYSDLLLKLLAKTCPLMADFAANIDDVGKDLLRLYQLPAIVKQLSGNLCQDKEQNVFYSVSERKFVGGGLPSTYQQQIMEGVECLSLLTCPLPIADLEKFKTAFKEKYESEEIPLLEALDPQLGIGFGEFASLKHNYSFLSETGVNAEHNNVVDHKPENDVAALLLNEWHFTQEQKREVEITDQQLKKIKAGEKKDMLPPSISVVFRLLGDQVYIENAGGCSALSLTGRFSCSDDVYAFTREIAACEQSHNKNVVFAEIAHVCNLHTANINRRKHLRDYEIPVLTKSVMEQDKQIQLSDILVSVINNTVVLRSKKLQKVIIPRLSSAFNYNKNCFPVFRFLCDIQRQDVKADFSFSFPSLVPGLRFYPRIRYKSCILQMAEWHFNVAGLDFLKCSDMKELLHLFKCFALAQGLPRYCAYVCYDNFLVFDLQNESEILLLIKEVKNKDLFVLREFPFPEDKSLAEDDCQRPLMAQYIASLYLKQEVYKGEKRAVTKSFRQVKDTSDWLYFKIYCHSLSANDILCNHMYPVIKKYKGEGSIQEWFWVRYQDPEYHIRLRIKTAKDKQGNIFEIVNTCLNKLCSTRLVHQFHTDHYKRETDRYSGELMHAVESVFYSSSELAINILKMKQALQWSDKKVLEHGVATANIILACFCFDPIQKAQFCKARFDEFFSEFGCPRNLKPEIEKLHRHISTVLNNQKNARYYEMLQKCIANLLNDHQNKKVNSVTVEKLAADIIHMHLNRLFDHTPRYFEMVVYFLTYRSLSVQMHKARQASF